MRPRIIRKHMILPTKAKKKMVEKGWNFRREFRPFSNEGRATRANRHEQTEMSREQSKRRL